MDSLNKQSTDSLASPDRQQVHAFITQIGENRQAFQLFKEQAQKRGIQISPPKTKNEQQKEYYERYIRNRTSEAKFQSVAESRESLRYSQSNQKTKNFVPLKDLLSKNLDDRIQDYLAKMDGMSVDEIVRGSGGALQTSAMPKQKAREVRDDESNQLFGTSRQQSIVEQTRSQANYIQKMSEHF